MHIHILGICGTFMGGIALLARAAGHRVSGCDAQVYPPMSEQLATQGITLIEGYDAAQTALKPDLFVVGNAISRGNRLLEAILDQGLPYVSGPQWLAEQILHQRWVLAVAGTHGKTTTTSMLAWILESAGLAPGFLVGGIPQNFGVSARLSDSRYFVLEADEYDTAFCDKRSKFVHYRPRTVILNNLEFDHADIFADLAAIETQFHHLIRMIPGQGRLIANARAPALRRVLDRGCWTPVEWFDDPNSAKGWHSSAPGDDAFWTCTLDDTHWGTTALGLPGSHNRSNALAAIAAARHVGVPPPQALEALRDFTGIKRRLEIRGVVREITVYDDFAHHPTAIAATLEGLRERVGSARVIAVLEPRSNTMKLGTLNAQLPESLREAQLIFCYRKNLGWDPGTVLAPLGPRVHIHDDMESLVSQIAHAAHPGDHILIMSNGGFEGVHDKLLALLTTSPQAPH
jgi:UDP-N-acetylmuramate: L-alanyl-gamma-D-glutamyl-meso-diaminopimelate ligase